ncbi:hypothetical protein ACA910_005813 [Epithemia clementina (nom. ined.)]
MQIKFFLNILLVILTTPRSSTAFTSLQLRRSASPSPPQAIAIFDNAPDVVFVNQARTTLLLAKKDSKDSRFSEKRRKQLGIGDDDEEYDLSMALDANTDPAISKIVAGSLILTLLALIVYGLLIPLTTDYGEGVCNPLLTQGRC